MRKPTEMILRGPAGRARLLALLLLASICWGTTAELTHHHRSNSRSEQTLFSTTEAQDIGAASSVRVESSKTNDTSSSSKTGAECLICQLHQNLAATALGHVPGVGTAETYGLHAPLSTVLQPFEFTATRHGRAPPVRL